MISGVYVPLLTPFDHQGNVDIGAYGAFAQWVASRGVDGLVPFGSTGEGPSLSPRERLAVLATLPEAVPGTSLIPAVTESSLDAVLEFVAAVNDLPATAIMVLPPYYFRPLAADDLRRFMEPVLAASRHPVLLYHIPVFGPPVPVEAITALAGPSLWGVKDSSGDIANTKAVLDAGANVMVGSEARLVEAVGLGAAGGICGLANLLPEHLVAAYTAAKAGDPEKGTAILAPALKFLQQMVDACPGSPVAWIPVAKQLAGQRSGVDLGGVRPPVPPASGTAAAAALAPSLEAVLSELAQA
ncbi:MAG TPA: dihydrodipicolinate synthase family protein [Streptosporangiaceae bacterium]|nr:dihydrodipicolinate synthase family protein [Streptosporangiaceae bacterium]